MSYGNLRFRDSHGVTRKVESLDDLVRYTTQIAEWTDELFSQIIRVRLMHGPYPLSFQRAANVAGVLVPHVVRWMSKQDLPRFEARADLAYRLCRAL